MAGEATKSEEKSVHRNTNPALRGGELCWARCRDSHGGEPQQVGVGFSCYAPYWVFCPRLSRQISKILTNICSTGLLTGGLRGDVAPKAHTRLVPRVFARAGRSCSQYSHTLE